MTIFGAWPALDSRDTVRYGVFLRPDAETCRVTLLLHDALRRQFGLIAAAVFPPHITLLGNIAITIGEPQLLEHVGSVVPGVTRFQLTNPGPEPADGALLCRLSDDRVSQLAQSIELALEGVRSPTDNDYLTGTTSSTDFHPHLTVAGQDLVLRPDLMAEVSEYAGELGITYPKTLTASWLSVFRFHSQQWPAVWWQDMIWQHLHSWRLES